jgi:hypothetical protein
MAHSTRRTAGRAHRSATLEVLTRAGFVGYGLLHLAVAWLALQIALGHTTEEGDQSGAFRVLLRQPFGRALLIAIAVGLAAMALWQLLEAAVGHQDERGKARVAERLASLGRTAVYAVLAWTAAQIVAGSSTSSANQQQNATAGVLAHPAGRLLVLLGGLAVIALGIGLAVYGARRMFVKRLRLARVTQPARQSAIRLGQVGYLAKGVAFAIAGVLLAKAALADSSARSRGLDGALRTLAGKSYGTLLLIVIAAGFAAFGLYCFFQSKYRKV